MPNENSTDHRTLNDDKSLFEVNMGDFMHNRSTFYIDFPFFNFKKELLRMGSLTDLR